MDIVWFLRSWFETAWFLVFFFQLKKIFLTFIFERECASEREHKRGRGKERGEDRDHKHCSTESNVELELTKL